MSALKDYQEKLKKAIEQRRSIILIETDDYATEEKRIECIFGELGISLSPPNSDDFGENIYKWLPGIGKRSLIYQDECIDESLCESIKEMPHIGDSTKSILIIRGLHFFYEMQSEEIAQITTLLHDFYIQNEAKPSDSRSLIIIISPKVDIPIELRSCLYSLTPPYPDDEDIKEELGLLDDIVFPDEENIYQVPNKEYKYDKAFFCSEGEDVYKSNRKKLLSALKGLRLHEIQTLLSYNNPSYTITGIDIEDFRENKKRMVQDSGLLKVEHFQEQKERYEEYVGDIDGLKKYMRKEKGVIDNRFFYNDKMPLPKGILLVGPPGCGKSETSKAIASILDMPLYSMDMGRLLGGLMGQSEHNFERALSIAEAAQPCVHRIDEIEKAFAGSGTNENDQTMTHIVGHFLTWMQERKSLVYLVATANNLDILRPEFLRKGRWDEIFYLTYPSSEGMRKIVVSCLKKYGLKMDDWEDDKEDRVLGDKTKKAIVSFYNKNKSIKVSGAEIADVIEQIYKSQFVNLQKTEEGRLDSEEKTKILDKAKTISVESFKKRLEKLSEKPKDIELNKAIDKEILDIEINQLLKQKSRDKQLLDELRKRIEEKYSDEAIEGMIESELDSLEISSMMAEHANMFVRDDIEKVLTKKYNRERLIQEETKEIKLNLLLQEDRLDSERKNILREKLKKKFKEEHIEAYYEARGYKSASTWSAD